MSNRVALVTGGGQGIGQGISKVLGRRLAQPSDVAAAVAFFASGDTGYITGQTLFVSGGLTMA